MKKYHRGLITVSVLFVAIIATVAAIGWRADTEPEVATPHFGLSAIAEQLGDITRIAITPTDEWLLVASREGSIRALRYGDSQWKLQGALFYTLPATSELHLTGLTVSADFNRTGDVFALYSANDAQVQHNRIMRLQFTVIDGQAEAQQPTLIYDQVASDPTVHLGAAASVIINDVGHLLVSVSSGNDAQLARNLNSEQGKILLMQRDGSNPLGARPYPEASRIQVIGVSDVQSLQLNADDPDSRFAIIDHSVFGDRLLYAPLLAASGKPDFGWDGSQLSFQKGQLYGWDDSENIHDVAFYPGRYANVPASSATESNLLLTARGSDTKHSAIYLGHLVASDNTFTLSLQTLTDQIIIGTTESLSGLASNESLGTVYFGGEDGALYQLKPSL